MVDLNILIQAKLNEQQSTAEINKQIAEIQKKLSTLKLDLKIDGAIAEKMKSVSQSTQQVTQAVQQQTQATVQQTKNLDKLATTYSGMGSQVEGITKRSKEWTDEDGKHFKLVQNINKETREITSTVQTETEDYKKLGQEIGKAREQTEKARIAEEKRAETVRKSEEKRNQQLEERKILAIGEQKMLEQQAIVAQQKLAASLDTKKFNLGGQMDVFGIRSSGLYNKDQFSALRKELDALVVSAPDAKEKLDGISRGFKGMQIEAQKGAVDLRAYGQSWQKTLESSLAKFTLWMAASTIFYQSFRFFTNGIKYSNDLNKSLSEVSIVTGQNQRQVAALGLEYQKLAMDMAVTTKEVANASVTFYRQGLSQVEVMNRVRVATQYAKISGLDFAQASEILTATVNSLNIPIEEAADVMAYLGEYCPAA